VLCAAGGDIIVGHPADLAAKVDTAALLINSSSSSSNGAMGGSGSKLKGSLSADDLHRFTLQELRSAGLTEAVAPRLQDLLNHFKQLVAAAIATTTTTGSSSSSSSSSAEGLLVRYQSAREAALKRSWVHAPLISLEPKGPATVDAQAFLKVAELAAAAGVSQHTVLWMRQMPAAAVADFTSGGGGAGAAGGGIVVTDLVREVKDSLMKAYNSSSGSASQIGAAAAEGAISTERPLLGLIVTDMLLQHPHLTALRDDALKLVPALLATAGGVNSAGSHEEAAAGMLQAFDLLAPSIKLPARVLQALLGSKPCLSWTLEDVGHVRKALWLGIDVAITNTPIAQLGVVRKGEGMICKGAG